ncbi:MAG: prolipoprotein diacylglyceryl transferase family protein [Byssovorax sp.]
MRAWSLLQLAAMALAFLGFSRGATGDRSRLRGCLVFAFPFAAAGAVGLGMLLRVPAWIRSGFQAAVLVHDADFMAYGALLGLVIAYALLARRRGFEPWSALDSLAAPLGILVGVARIGCFVAGCDHGTITGAPWAVRYPAGTAAFRSHLDAGLIQASDARSLPVHPAQLYESLVGVTMVFTVLALQRWSRGRTRPLLPGTLFVAAATIYAVGRFLVEMVRGDDRGMLGPLSTPQWLSVAAVLYLVGWGLEARGSAGATSS